MNSAITSKFQTTIPKAIRDALGISIHDALEWSVEQGRAVVYPLHGDFLKRRGSIHVPQGDIAADIARAREAMAERFR